MSCAALQFHPDLRIDAFFFLKAFGKILFAIYNCSAVLEPFF